MISLLYVDDEPDLLDVARLFLEDNKLFKVDTASSAAESITKMKDTRYDAIISDYQMPEMDGIEFLKHVRAESDIPFGLFTGKGREEIVIEAINHGADFYLQKGGDPKALFAELSLKINQSVRRRQVEVQLQESEKRYRTVIETVQDTIYQCNNQGTVTMVSPSWVKLLGYESFGECIGKNIAEAFYFDPLQREAFLNEVNSRGFVENYPITMKRKDGSPVIVATSSHLYYGDSGEVLGVEGIFRDITRQHEAERQLAENREHLEAVLQGTPIPTFVIDSDRCLVSWNRAIEDYTGIKAEHVLGKPLAGQAFYKSDRPSLADMIVTADVAGIPKWYGDNAAPSPLIGGAYEATGYFPSMKGGTWLFFTAAPVLNSEGKIIGAVETLQDISVQKRAEAELLRKNEELSASYEELTVTEEELRQNYEELAMSQQMLHESETSYRKLVDNAISGIYRSTPEGSYTEVNPAFARIFGYESPADMKAAISDIRQQVYVHPGDRDRIRELVEKDGYVRNFLAEFHHRDGHQIWLSVNVVPVYDGEGMILYYEGTTEDVTGRKLAEEQLKQKTDALSVSYEQLSVVEEELRQNYDELRKHEVALKGEQELLHATIESTNAGILVVDAKGNVTHYNTRFGVMWGIPDDILASRDDHQITDYIIGQLADPGAFLSKIHELYGSAEHVSDCVEFLDGRIFERESLPLVHNGAVSGRVWNFYDVTELKRAEELLMESNLQLNLMTNITRHDILNKILVVLGYVSLLRSKTTDPVMRSHLDKVESATEAIRAQIVFTRTYQELGAREPAWQDPGDLVQRLQVPANISCSVELQDIEILADPMLEKVFYNLLDNSVRHGGNVTRVRVYSSKQEDPVTVFWEDNGTGIPESEKEKIFERGYGKNTGFGMFLVREVLNLTDITISETGTPGQGARFGMKVPKEAYRFRK
ncbi:MAG: PAS domain S-box protein [Methanomicrobiales archaeon]